MPEGVTFATKPALAMTMIGHALDAGVRADFVLADEVYGNDGKFRRFLEGRGQAYVPAVKSDQRLWVKFEQERVDQIATGVPAKSWSRLSVAPVQPSEITAKSPAAGPVTASDTTLSGAPDEFDSVAACAALLPPTA